MDAAISAFKGQVDRRRISLHQLREVHTVNGTFKPNYIHKEASTKLVRLSLISITAALSFSTSALAVDVRNAVNQCVNLGSSCIHNTSPINGSIVIFVDGKTICCESDMAECQVIGRLKKGFKPGVGALAPKGAPLKVFPGN